MSRAQRLVLALGPIFLVVSCRAFVGDVACNGDEDCPPELPLCVEKEGTRRCQLTGAPSGDGGAVDGGHSGLDGGVVDGGAADGGAADSGAPDAGVVDDGGGLDAGRVDGGGGEGVDAGPCVPGPVGHLVINEIDYDQDSTDPAEFVEILNPTCEPVSLQDLELIFVNGSDKSLYRRQPLVAAAPSLGPRAYLVVADPGVVVPVTTVALQLPGLDIQNGRNGATGTSDGVALYDTAQDTLVDAVAYEGNLVAVPIDGQSFAMTEGPHGPLDIDLGEGDASLVRFPDGNDTDDSRLDWALSWTPTPGARNVRQPLWPDSATAFCSDGAAQISCADDGSALGAQDGAHARLPPRYDDDGLLVHDQRTGLAWESAPEPLARSYSDAVGRCNFIEDGTTNFRIPTMQELASLLDLGRQGQVLDPALFGDLTGVGALWTAQAEGLLSGPSWALRVEDGLPVFLEDTDSAGVLCVFDPPTMGPPDFVVIDSVVNLDLNTRLSWDVFPSNSALSWEAAFDYCRARNLAGFTDWRLPTLKELLSIFDPRFSPAINTSYFPSGNNHVFVSATPDADNPGQILAVDLSADGAGTSVTATGGGYVRCVRGGDVE